MRVITFLKGAAIGAGIMYLFDPSQGRSRRARIRDTSVHAWNEFGDTVESTAKDAANRARGVLHEASKVVSGSVERSGLGHANNQTPAWMPANWSPTTKMVVTAAAGLLAMYGKRRGGAVGAAIGALSLGLLTRSVSRAEMTGNSDNSPSLPSDFPPTESEEDRRAVSGEHRPRGAQTF